MVRGKKAALVIVDVQNDFCPGGALGVPGGDEVVPVLNSWIGRFARLGLPVAFTLDWHPADHCSFLGQGGTWPAHCVQGTPGGALRSDLDLSQTGPTYFKKGFHKGAEAYSGFDGRLDGSDRGLTLEEWLEEHGVGKILVGGLATDYCVKATVEDGLKRGFEVGIIKDGIRAVEVNSGDGERALDAMLLAGAKIVTDNPSCY